MVLFDVPTGHNRALTFAGAPVVYEHEWNQITRRQQPYMSAIVGMSHDSFASSASIAVFRLENP